MGGRNRAAPRQPLPAFLNLSGATGPTVGLGRPRAAFRNKGRQRGGASGVGGASLFGAAPVGSSLWLLPRGNHAAVYATEDDVYRAKLLAFLRANLGAPGPFER